MLEHRIVPRVRELGDGFTVRRALPSAERRNVGPFVFFDAMGPVTLAPGHGLDVRPHPHIGLATVTYLFAGEIQHRDSLGSVQAIRPGEVNWMTAGRGIVHSERTPSSLRAAGSPLAGIQLWVALPREAEEAPPSFSHHAVLPTADDDGVRLRVVLGKMAGVASPVVTLSPMICVDAALVQDARLAFPADHEERGVYVVEGEIEIEGVPHAAGEMLVFARGGEPVLRGRSASRVLLFGGAPLDGPRHVWWNFVSSSKERIAQAAADWQAGRFPAVPGETEFIPLPA